MTCRELFRAEGLPVLQNRVYRRRDDALAAPTGDVVLVQDETSGLIFNQAFDPGLMVYDSEYQNEQAWSPTFRRHLEEVVSILEPFISGRRILEVGCGKGYFLELLLETGHDAMGIDPAYEGDSPHVIKAPFGPGIGVSGECVILRHVLEHIPDPMSFLLSIQRANGRQGLIYIEVPCFDWICVNRAWFDVFYEHANYFRVSDFERMFSRLHASGHLFGGQYLYVIADLADLREPTRIPGDTARLPQDFTAGIQTSRNRAIAHPGPKAIWGGASKGVIFAHYLSKQNVEFDAVIDINRAKQGQYLPVSGLPVLSPEQAMDRFDPGAMVFVMNPNYFDEIVRQSQHRFLYVST